MGFRIWRPGRRGRFKALSETRPTYLLYDDFGDDRAVGAVNGTLARVGGARTVTDTNSKISTAGGVLDFATGAAANDAVWYPSTARAAGRALLARLVISEATNGIPAFGWDSAASGALLDSLKFGASGVLQIVADGGTAFNVGAYTATTYDVAAVMRATGMFWFIKGGVFTNWTFLTATALGSAAGFPAIQAANTTAVFGAAHILIPAALWLPSPLLSDSFTRGDGALGSTDGLGHAEGNGGGGLAWVFDAGVWTIATNKAVGTPTAGSEVLTDDGLENWTSPTNLTSWTESISGTSTINQETTDKHGGSNAARFDLDASDNAVEMSQGIIAATGVWVLITGWYKTTSTNQVVARLASPYTDGPALSNTSWTQAIQVLRSPQANPTFVLRRWGSGASQSVYLDDWSAKALTLSSLFTTHDLGTPNVKVRAKCGTLVTGTQMGVCARVDNPATPTQGVTCYFDGAGNVKLDEFTGTTTWTNKLSGAQAFTAKDEIELDVDGAAYRVYHTVDATKITTLIGSGTLASVLTGNNAGLFSTYSGNKFSSCVVSAKGAEGQYNVLDQIAV